ncbi:MAG: hypothetical protein LVS60_05750 [Nodosilinea sp. LVE1205-7]
MVQSYSYQPLAAIAPSPSLSVHSLLQPITLVPNPSLLKTWTDGGTSQANLVALSPTPLVAKQFNQDILGDISHTWKHFIDSGQVWALVIGVVLGYLIRNLTAY